MFLKNIISGTRGNGYIAGTGDGIVTVASQPAIREVIALDALTLILVARTTSFARGNYMITGLDPNGSYLIMARDYKKEFESFVWDHVEPADDLTLDDQQALLQSWQAI